MACFCILYQRMTYNFRFVGFQRNQALFDIDKVFLAIEKSLADCLKLALLHDSPVYHINSQLHMLSGLDFYLFYFTFTATRDDEYTHIVITDIFQVKLG